MSVRVQIVGNRDLAGRFAQVAGRRRARARTLARTTAEDVAASWAAATRSRRVAGAIKISEVQPVRYAVEAASADVGFNPAFVEFDTAPHRIEPTKDHGFLANPDTGFFVKGGVNHPGTTGDHALAGAMDAARPAYLEGLRQIWGGS